MTLMLRGKELLATPGEFPKAVSTRKPSLECPLCGNRYAKIKTLRSHMMKYHAKEYPKLVAQGAFKQNAQG